MRRLHLNRSLQARLTFFNVAAVAVALVITAAGVLVDRYQSIREHNERELNSIGAFIVSNTQAHLLFEDHGAALDLLTSLASLESDVDACLVDADGHVFAAYPVGLDWQDRLAMYARSEEPPRRYACRVDVVVGDKIIGTAYLTAGMQGFYDYMNEMVLALAWTMGVALLVSIYVGRRTLLSILQPLSDLERAARQIIRERTYSLRVPHGSDDELGRLTDSFNDMLVQIETRDVALTSSRDDLERRVAERTRELELEVGVRKVAEDSMREAMEEAETANRAKSEFLANMSHELRMPLHGILSFAQFGLREAAAGDMDALTGHYEAIKSSGETLLLLLDDLLDLAKLESGRMTFDFQRCRVDDLIEAAVAEFDSLVSMRRQEIRLVQEARDLEMELDPNRMMQVLRNLLSNAVKFSPEDGVVTVASAVRDDRLVLSVSDRGVGVPEAEREDVFDKFIQSSKTKTGAGGTGLGLAITREIVEAHRGRVTVADNPGGGAVFTVVLPLEPAPIARALELAPRP